MRCPFILFFFFYWSCSGVLLPFQIAKFFENQESNKHIRVLKCAVRKRAGGFWVWRNLLMSTCQSSQGNRTAVPDIGLKIERSFLQKIKINLNYIIISTPYREVNISLL